MDRAHSYVMLLYLEFEALVLDIFDYLFASPKDDYSPIMLAYTKSISTALLIKWMTSCWIFLFSYFFEDNG